MSTILYTQPADLAKQPGHNYLPQVLTRTTQDVRSAHVREQPPLQCKQIQEPSSVFVSDECDVTK